MSVNDKKRGRPQHSQRHLSAETIVSSARTLMQQEGKVPSIRHVANALCVDPMAIYHYFSNKAALLEAVTVSLIETIYQPTGQSDWQSELTQLCHSYLQLLKNHTGLLETMLSMSEEGPAQVFGQRFYLALSPLALDGEVLKNALDLMADYLHGFALAMHCHGRQQELTVDLMAGPLGLYLRALEHEGRWGQEGC